MSHEHIIRPLSSDVINQIAAGEVVERPASIVKELIENSLDAGAKRIFIELDGGGIDRIQVRDNGCGIPPLQLQLALSRHCTSKLVSAADLQTIQSLGFRGEALASIGAVTELSITSRTADDTHGWRVDSRSDSSDLRPVPQPHPVGTTIEVRALFANTPARRRFLKQPRTELLHIQQFLRRAGFCYPNVEIVLVHDARPSLKLPPVDDSAATQRRWRTLFGSEFVESCVPIEVQLDGVAIGGWVGKPSYSRQNSDLQYIAINRRVVRDRHIAHAIRMAYESAIADGRHAAYALRIDLPSQDVDVNVHPGKAEVRFSDPRTIHDLVYACVKHALLGGAETQGSVSSYPDPFDKQASQAVINAPLLGYQHASRSLGRHSHHSIPPRASADELLVIVENRFAITNRDAQLLVIDLHRAIEVVVRKRLSRGESAARPLIIPEAYKMRLRDADITNLGQYGFEVTRLGSDSIALRAIPVVVGEIDAREFGVAVIENVADGVDVPNLLARAASQAFRSPRALVECRRWYAALAQLLQEFEHYLEDYGVALSAAQLNDLFERP
ncbi:MAG: DNA mismatch repair endonuclease MutL [Proteobacteria bacterium]|nr:DNA mismatch repair endonuclease MutL [Pseudomonadota bacterium]